jgi:hypothetical protein
LDDLIKPLIRIANFNQIPQTHIDELTSKYNIISEEAIPQMNSKYKDIVDYTSYVYCIYDTIKYKWYIGVRYGRHRYNKNNLQDLMQYQSSSKDITFKHILKNNIFNERTFSSSNKGSNTIIKWK